MIGEPGCAVERLRLGRSCAASLADLKNLVRSSSGAETLANGAIVEKFGDRGEGAEMGLKLVLGHHEENHKFHWRIVESFNLDALGAATERSNHFGYPVAGRV